MSRFISSFALTFFLLPQTAFGAPSAPEWGAAESQSSQAPARSTWEVAVAEPNVCSRDADFATRLTTTVPEERRAPPGSISKLRALVRYADPRRATVEVIENASGRTVGSRDVPVAEGGCDAAAATIGFVLAVLFQTEPALSAQSAAEPPPEPPPQPPPPVPAEPAPTAPRRRRLGTRYAWLGPGPSHELSAAAGVALGLLPGLPVGGRASWVIRPAQGWPFGIWASGWSAQSVRVADTHFGAAYGGVSLCPLHRETVRFQLRGCLGLGAGAVWAHARDGSLYENETWRKPFGFLGAEGNAAVRVAGPLFAELGLRADLALPRRTYYYVRTDGVRRNIFQTSWVLGHLFLGLSLRFR